MTSLDLPQVTLCLATSLDGKISEAPGAAPAFTSRYDREKLFALRSQAHALLIGANTVRQEKLPPLVRNETHRQARLAQGLSEHPDVVLVTASMNLPWESSYFSQAKQKIYVLTGLPKPEVLEKARKAQVQVISTKDSLDLHMGLRKLKAEGYDRLLCEGGGTLVRSMLAADLVDKIHLTVAPTLIGGRETPSLVSGPVLKPRPEFNLISVDQVASELHLVYAREDGASSDAFEKIGEW